MLFSATTKQIFFKSENLGGRGGGGGGGGTALA